jgi:hypothetical protein
MTQRTTLRKKCVAAHLLEPAQGLRDEFRIAAFRLERFAKGGLGGTQYRGGRHIGLADGRQQGKAYRLKRQRSGEQLSVRCFKAGKSFSGGCHADVSCCCSMAPLSSAGVVINPISGR